MSTQTDLAPKKASALEWRVVPRERVPRWLPAATSAGAVLVALLIGAVIIAIAGGNISLLLAVAIVLRTIDAFGTFDQVVVLTRGGPGEATKLLSIFGYDTAFKFQQTGYAAAMFVTMGLIVLAFALGAVRLLRRVEAR